MKITPAIFIITLGITSPVNAQDFVDSVRELNAAQNRMAVGKEKAKDQVASQFDAVEALTPTLEPEAWAQSRNIRAAIVYLLSGGAPESLREIHDAGFVVGDESGLLEAALLNAEGDERAAEKIAAFEPGNYPPLLAGHLALVQGGALVGRDNPRAIASLDLARLLMPTSLVEEAAIRREMRALNPERDREKIISLAQAYAAKYRASPYARNFIADVRAIIFGPVIKADPSFVSKVNATIDIAPAPERLDIYLALCRSALLAGRFDDAHKFLAKAAPAAETTEMRDRLQAYQRVVDRIEAPAQSAPDQKDENTASSLTDDDKQTVLVLQAVLTRLSKPHSEGKSPEEKASPDNDTALVANVRARLEHVDSLLNGHKTK